MSDTEKTFLAIGECMVELAPLSGDDYRVGFAGDTFNSAWYARRLLPRDFNVAYGTCVGDDAISARMLGFMAQAGIDTSTVRQVPGKTVGLYMIQLDKGERSFSYWRGQSAARSLGDDPAWLAQITAGAGTILFSGITLAILSEQGRRNLLDALASARAGGATVAFDPNLRPRLWPDPAAMCAAMMQAAAVAEIALPSFDEEALHFGDADPAATVERYRKAGVDTVIVKDGENEICVGTGAGPVQGFIPAKAPQVVDTTAAGDSFNAGFLTARMQGRTLADAVQAGMELAARVVQAKGALVEAAIPQSHAD